mmetsp:Transcript_11330/g.22084  ORF Transcript_11330/g.22084 Transcript_11330/m.22084 type:complete len:142 (+) Transcript_11330:463-888(+)
MALKRFLEKEYPNLQGNIFGSNYQSSWIIPYLLQGAGVMQVAAIALMVFGDQLFSMLGIQTPEIVTFMRQYQVQTFMFLFVLSSVAQNLAASGAFEIAVGDKVVYSKLQAGRMPTLEEIVNLLDDAGVHRLGGRPFEDRQI